MERWVKCLNTSGLSGLNRAAAKSNTIDVNGDNCQLHYVLAQMSIVILQSRGHVWITEDIWVKNIHEAVSS